jgi:hypothetical protein
VFHCQKSLFIRCNRLNTPSPPSLLHQCISFKYRVTMLRKRSISLATSDHILSPLIRHQYLSQNDKVLIRWPQRSCGSVSHSNTHRPQPQSWVSNCKKLSHTTRVPSRSQIPMTKRVTSQGHDLSWRTADRQVCYMISPDIPLLITKSPTWSVSSDINLTVIIALCSATLFIL